MSTGWSMWTLGPSGRWRREYLDGDGSLYRQWDNYTSAICDSKNVPLSQAVVALLGIPRDDTPRFAAQGDAQPFDQFNNLSIGSNPSYGYGNAASRNPKPINVIGDSRPSDEKDDGLGPLPDTKIVIDADNMKGKPKEKGDLVSLKTTGSLPAGYTVQDSNFFVLGRVFRVLWVEPMGTTSKSFKRDDDVFTTLRPVVVVRKGPAQCTCVPIHSYGRQGIGKSGLSEYEIQHHAIIYMSDKEPRLTSTEKKMASKIKLKDAFAVDPVNNASLLGSSRIRFDAPFTVKYNVKVLELGRVIVEDRPRLTERFQKAFK